MHSMTLVGIVLGHGLVFDKLDLCFLVFHFCFRVVSHLSKCQRIAIPELQEPRRVDQQ